MASYIYNHTPYISIKFCTPFEKWYEYKPDISIKCQFDYVAYSRIPQGPISKLDPRAKCIILVGCINTGYRLLEPETRTITDMSNVHLIENLTYSNIINNKSVVVVTNNPIETGSLDPENGWLEPLDKTDNSTEEDFEIDKIEVEDIKESYSEDER